MFNRIKANLGMIHIFTIRQHSVLKRNPRRVLDQKEGLENELKALLTGPESPVTRGEWEETLSSFKKFISRCKTLVNYFMRMQPAINILINEQLTMLKALKGTIADAIHKLEGKDDIVVKHLQELDGKTTECMDYFKRSAQDTRKLVVDMKLDQKRLREVSLKPEFEREQEIGFFGKHEKELFKDVKKHIDKADSLLKRKLNDSKEKKLDAEMTAILEDVKREIEEINQEQLNLTIEIMHFEQKIPIIMNKWVDWLENDTQLQKDLADKLREIVKQLPTFIQDQQAVMHQQTKIIEKKAA